MSNRSTSPTSLARKAVAVEIALLRTPLVLADRVATRLGAQDVVRPKVRQGMVLLDALADALRGGAAEPSGDSSPPPASSASAATARPASEAATARPTREESAPARVPETSPAEPNDAEPDDAAPNDAAPNDAAPNDAVPDNAELIDEVTEELLEEQEVAPHAGELADDDELRRVQAELNAKRLVAEQQESRPD